MMTIVNSRADLEALRGAPAFAEALLLLYGSMTGWSLVGGAWVAVEDLSLVERFEYSKPEFLAEIEPFDFPAPVPPPLPEPEVEPVPQEISRRQFYQGLEVIGKISKVEALAAIKSGAIPAALQAILDGMTDPDAVYEADCLLSGASTFNRQNPVVLVFAIVQGMTEADVDEFWILCFGL